MEEVFMPADPISACESPSNRAWPIQYLEFQREITSDQDPAGPLPDQISLQCEKVNVTVRGSILAKFVQEWSLEDVLIGDFVTLLTLAPSEVLTIEMRRTQHTLLEQSQETASTVQVGTDSLDSDKESINAANTSARTANWSVSGTGGFSLYGIGASGSASNSGTVNSSTTSTVNSIHETTLKSTKKVTTQTKLQIRGVTETTVEARQTRILKNPFPDRVLELNLYEVVKKFNVKTYQPNTTYLQLLITATVNAIKFTQAFISSNQAFLQDALLDAQLQSVLPTIVGALQQAQPSDEQARINNALDALEKYLFEDRPGVQPYHDGDYQNDTPTNAFTNANVNPPPQWTNMQFGAAGVAIGESKSAAFEIYINEQMYWMIMGGYPAGSALPTWPAPIYPAQRLQLMQGLAAKVRDAWESKLDDAGRIALMKVDNHGRGRTEIFRRVPGFLKLYDELLGNVSIPQPDAATVALISALMNHLNCNADYYTEQYIRFAWNKLGSTFVIQLTNDILSSLFPPPAGYVEDTSRPYLNLYQVEDVQRSGLSILIPVQSAALTGNASIRNFSAGLTQLDNAMTGATLPEPQQAEVIVPTEGIHMEPVAGSCVLQLPSSSGGQDGNGNGDDNGKGDGNDSGNGKGKGNGNRGRRK